MAKKKNIQVTFEPGCFDDWDGTQEELDVVMAEIVRLAEFGELGKDAVPVDDEVWDELSQAEQDIISGNLQRKKSGRTRH